MAWGSDNINTQSTVQTNPFSNADVYRLQSQWYYDQWNTALWDAYKALRSWSDAFSNVANQINDFYSQLWQDVYKREMALAWEKQALADRLLQDMWQTRQYALDMFWPNGQLTREVNRYYDDLWNYLATDAWRQAAEIAAQWMHSWASLWAIRAQQNELKHPIWQLFKNLSAIFGVALCSAGVFLLFLEQEINAKQQIASNLINYMSTLRQEYWDTTNQYVIQQYQRANDLLNSISQSIAGNNIQLAQAKLNSILGWSSTSYSYDIYWNLINNKGEIIFTKDELAKINNENKATTVDNQTNSNSTEGASFAVW